MTDRPTDERIAEMMGAYAEICVNSAKDIGGITLDYSSASVATLDAFVGTYWPEGKPGAEKAIPDAIQAAAAYLGEVIVRSAAGVRWIWAEKEEAPMLLFPRGERADTRTWVYRRIFEGQARRDLRHYYQVALDLASGAAELKDVAQRRPLWKRLRGS